MNRDKYMDYEHPETPGDERRREEAMQELRDYAYNSSWYKGAKGQRHYGIECARNHCTCTRPEDWEPLPPN